MNETLIRLTEVCRRTGFSKVWIYRLISEGRFPTPVRTGTRAVAFVESEIDAWIAARIAASRGEAQQ